MGCFGGKPEIRVPKRNKTHQLQKMFRFGLFFGKKWNES